MIYCVWCTHRSVNMEAQSCPKKLIVIQNVQTFEFNSPNDDKVKLQYFLYDKHFILFFNVDMSFYFRHVNHSERHVFRLRIT